MCRRHAVLISSPPGCTRIHVMQTQATTEMRHAHWRADERTRRLLPNGALTWASDDGVAQFELPHHRRFFRVTMPVALPEEPESVGRRGCSNLAPAVRSGWLSGHGFYMKTLVQTHLCNECPARWRELLVAACTLPSHGEWTVQLPTAAATVSQSVSRLPRPQLRAVAWCEGEVLGRLSTQADHNYRCYRSFAAGCPSAPSRHGNIAAVLGRSDSLTALEPDLALYRCSCIGALSLLDAYSHDPFLTIGAGSRSCN